MKILPLLLVSAAMLSAGRAAAHPLQTWRERFSSPGSQPGFSSVAWGNGQFVAIGGTNSASSTNGVDWLARGTGLDGLRSITFGSTQFMAVGLYGVIATSSNGLDWLERTPDISSNHLTDISFGGGVFVTVGEGGRILVSADGADWVQAASGTTSRLDDVEYGNGLFLLPLLAGTNLVSRDATNWFRITSGTSRGIYTIGFGGGRFLQVDTERQVWTSADGTNWTHHGAINGIRPPCAAWGHGEFVVASNPALEYRDGVNWTSVGTNITASGIAFGNGSFVVAAGAKIYQSDPVIRLQLDRAGAMTLLGPVGAYRIEAVELLGSNMAWETITNLTATNSPMRWSVAPGSNEQRRVYRAALLIDEAGR